MSERPMTDTIEAISREFRAATERAEKAERERDALKKLVEDAAPRLAGILTLLSYGSPTIDVINAWLAQAKEALKK